MERTSSLPRIALILGLFAALFGLAGCASIRNPQVVLGPKYKPTNIHRLESFVPPPIRRVAVLPMTSASNDWQAESGRSQLEPILLSELGKSKQFECVIISAQQIHAWTGRGTVRADDVLPAEMFERLQKQYNCDAVLFAHLSAYRAYRPLLLGWNLKLVELSGSYVVWSADETFDANAAPVANAAQYYYIQQNPKETGDPERSTILMSPRHFAEYSLSALFDTLPAPPKVAH